MPFTDDNIKHKFIKEFEVKDPAANESIEDYELGFNNVANIKILDSNHMDVTGREMQIVFNINYNGLKDFTNMLLVLANNYDNQQEYRVAHVKQQEQQYNMGILLSEK